MTSKFIQSSSRIIWDTDLMSSRFTLAIAEFMWAILLLWPGEVFQRPLYIHLASVMGEDAWGLVFLLSGVTQLTIMLLNDVHSRFARYFAGWNSVLWMYVVISLVISEYPPPASIGGEIAMSIIASWIWVRPYLLAQGYKNVRKLPRE